MNNSLKYFALALAILALPVLAQAAEVTSLDGSQGWYRTSVDASTSTDQASVGSGSLKFDHAAGESVTTYYIPEAPFAYLIELFNGQIRYDGYLATASENLPGFVLFLSTPLSSTEPLESQTLTTLTWEAGSTGSGWNTYDPINTGTWTSNGATPETKTLAQWIDSSGDINGFTQVTGWGFSTDPNWAADTLAYADNTHVQFSPLITQGLSSDPIIADFEAAEATPVPEPSTLLLAGLGVTGLLFWRRRKA